MKLNISFAVALLATAALGLGTLSQAPVPAEPAMPAVSWVGPHCKITQPRFVRIATPAAWADLWHEYTGEGRQFKDHPFGFPPDIDFKRFEIVGYFRGNSINANGEAAESIDVAEDRIRIRFNSMSFQTSAPIGGGPDRGVSVTPYGLWLIDRTDKPVVIEENVQDLIGKPPIWKEQHRFETPAR